MAVTYVEVLDTAVKIGLGALISGASGYYIAKLTHSRDIEKERLRRRREMLEQVAMQFEAFTHVALKYWAYILHFQRHGPMLSVKQMRRLRKARSELFHAFKELSVAEGKLLLLNERSCQRASRDYGDFVGRFHSKYRPDVDDMSEAAIEAAHAEILAKRAACFDALTGAYGKT